MRRPEILLALAFGLVVASMFTAPRPSQAMPTFAQAYGVSCSTCHTQVPLLNAYGRYIQRTGYTPLDRAVLTRALPAWIGESANYDSTAGSGTGTPRTSFGNLALHGAGYVVPDVTFHAQQWVTQNDQSGSLDTLWVTYNKLFHRDGHLFAGKIENPAPAPYSQDFELDGAGASSTVVGEHDWAATYGNRWGTKLSYVRKAVNVEAGYLLSADDLNGLTDFRPGDKTFQWKVAYARPDFPAEFGVFGSNGSIPVSTGTDAYRSVAGYVQVDPGHYGRPGIFAVYQSGRDDNPGIDASSGNGMPATSSRGASFEIYEPVLRRNATLAIRHDFNDNGFGTVANGNAINLAFNIPHFPFAHGYLETNLGGNSALAGASGGPTWKGMMWLTLPIKNVTSGPSPASAPSNGSGTPAKTLSVVDTPDENVAHGKALYGANCASCHGATGTEGGVGPSLKGEKSKKDQAAVVAWIKHPAPPMPKLYPSPLSEKDVAAVAAYLETL